jgi:Lipocalin-like domain
MPPTLSRGLSTILTPEGSLMNNRNVFGLSAAAALGLAILSTSAFAQTKSLKEQLVGSYTLAKAFDTSSDGKDNDVWGPGVQGSLMLDPSGHFSLFIVAAGRAKGDGTDARVPVGNIVAHYGTYTVDETAKTISYHYEKSTFPPWDGVDSKGDDSVIQWN